eukprot:jgi/Astpho2/9303/fgenesh1_pg.00139_%23_24_t
MCHKVHEKNSFLQVGCCTGRQGCSLICSLSTSFLPGLFVRGGCCSPSARAAHHLGKEHAELDPLRLLQSNTQPEEQAAEGANKSGRPSKQEQPYSATRVSTLAAQWEQAQAGRQVAAGPPAGLGLVLYCRSTLLLTSHIGSMSCCAHTACPLPVHCHHIGQAGCSSEHCCAAGDEPHQAATATATAAQQPSASDPQKDMASHAAAAGEAASRPAVQLGQPRMSRTQILPEPAQQTEARPEAPAGTRQVQASAQQELGAAAGHEVRDWQRQGGHSDAQAPQATAADAHDHDLWQRQRQQQQTQAEQPSAAEAPAVQQEGLLQGPQGPLGPDGPQKGALQGAHGPQAEQRAEQSAATTAAVKQDARGERPRAAASGGRASPAAAPVRAEAPPQGATADTELAAAGSAQAAAAGSAARASVLAALASTPADAAAVNAAWESAAAAAEQRPPTAAERRQTPTPAAPATTSQPASHRRSSVGGREYPAGPPPSPTASEQRLVHQQTFRRQQVDTAGLWWATVAREGTALRGRVCLPVRALVHMGAADPLNTSAVALLELFAWRIHYCCMAPSFEKGLPAVGLPSCLMLAS